MTHVAPTILVADADEPTRAFMAAQLTVDGYEVLEAALPAQVRARAVTRPVALLQLGESLALLRELRAGDGLHGQLDPGLPVVVVSRDGGELGVLRSLDAGADDHLAKPFSYPELRARIAAVLRRTRVRPDVGVTRIGELEVDRVTRQVRLRGERIELSQRSSPSCPR